VDAAARIELLQHRLDGNDCESYEQFAEEIVDPDSKARFLEALKEWKSESAAQKSNMVPWPASKPLGASRSSGSSMEEGTEQYPPVPVFTRPAKMQAERTHFGKCSQNLEDLVLYFNAAARVGRGNLMWAGWNASQWSAGGPKTRNTSPTSGAQLVLLTAIGARFLCDKREEIPDMHMGNFFAKLCGLKWQEELGSSYIQPPIGSFVAHESTTTPGAHLGSHFDSRWAQEGTRIEKEGQQLRYVCGFTQKGVAHWLHTEGIDLRDEGTRRKFIWKTQPMPTMPDYLTGFQPWHGFPDGEDSRLPQVAVPYTVLPVQRAFSLALCTRVGFHWGCR
jgi:hypothetical protein